MPNINNQSVENAEEKFLLPIVELDDSDNLAIENLLDTSTNVPFEADDNDNLSEATGNTHEHDQGNESHGYGPEMNDSEMVAIGFGEDQIGTEIQSNAQKSTQSTSISKNRDDSAASQMHVTEIMLYGEDEIEITYLRGQKLRPKIDSSLLKANDLLSANLPFHENVWHRLKCIL